jgi:hypothetical protein
MCLDSRTICFLRTACTWISKLKSSDLLASSYLFADLALSRTRLRAVVGGEACPALLLVGSTSAIFFNWDSGYLY